MLNETGITEVPPVVVDDANSEFDLANVISFPTKNKQSVAFSIPLSAITARFSPPKNTDTETVEIDDPATILNKQRQSVVLALCDVYTREIFFKLSGLGYDVLTEEFEKDLQFVYEALSSALLRTFKVAHPIQEFVDNNFEVVQVSGDGDDDGDSPETT